MTIPDNLPLLTGGPAIVVLSIYLGRISKRVDALEKLQSALTENLTRLTERVARAEDDARPPRGR